MRRKNYFIKKRFQTGFFLRFVLLVLLESVLIVGIFMYIAGDTITTGYFDSVLRVDRTLDVFFMPMFLIIVVVGIGISIAGMVTFILLSHRIAGPLYRFENDLKEIQKGDLTKRISLRKTDQLEELRGTLNSLIRSLDVRMGKMQSELSEIQKLIDDIDNNPENLEKLNRAIDLLKNEVEYFKISRGQKD